MPLLRKEQLVNILTSNTPNSVGTSNSTGSSPTAALSDHTHAHGTQTDTSLHALATTSTAGFLSAADKSILDTLSDNDNINVINHGAIGSGLVDDSAAIQDTFSEEDTAYYPEGTYLIDSNVTLGAASKTHYFAKGAKLYVNTGKTLTLMGYIQAEPDQHIFDGPGTLTLSLDNHSYIAAGWFGALGNNSHDDTTAINSAITAAASFSGRVYLPKGIYKHNSTINLASNVILEGDGYSSVLSSGATSIDNITFSSVNNVIVRHLVISGSSVRAIRMVSCNNITIDSCDISGGLGGVTDNAYGIAINGCTDIYIKFNHLHGNGKLISSTGGKRGADIYVESGAISSHLTISDNRIESGYTIFNIFANDASYLNISNNYLNGSNNVGSGSDANTSGYGLAVYDANLHISENLISNNIIESTAGSGIYYQGIGSSDSPRPFALIQNNVIVNTCLTQSDTNVMVGAIACNAPGVVISDNSINTVGSQGSGITFSGNNNILSGNFILGVAARPAIYLRGTTGSHVCANSVISGNTIRECQKAIFGSGLSTLNKIIVSSNSCNDFVSGGNAIEFYDLANSTLTDNIIDGAGKYGIYLSGPTATTKNNIIASNIITNCSNDSHGTYSAIYNQGSHTDISHNRVYGTYQNKAISDTGTYNRIALNDGYGNIKDGYGGSQDAIDGYSTSFRFGNILNESGVLDNKIPNINADTLDLRDSSGLFPWSTFKYSDTSWNLHPNLGGGTLSLNATNTNQKISVKSKANLSIESQSDRISFKASGQSLFDFSYDFSVPIISLDASQVASALYLYAPGSGQGIFIFADKQVGLSANQAVTGIISFSGKTISFYDPNNVNAGNIVNSANSFAIKDSSSNTRLTVNTTGIGFYTASPVAQASRATQLTDSTTGSTASNSGACVDVTSAGVSDPVKVNDNFAKVLDRLNKLETIIHNLGLSA